MLAACDKPHGERFAVAGPYLTVRQVVDTLANVSGRKAPAFDMPAPLALLYARIVEGLASLTGRNTVVSYAGVAIMAEQVRIDSGKAERELAVRYRPFYANRARRDRLVRGE